MTDLPPPPAPPPPGWYPDPTTGGQGFRWWDGNGWTDQRSTSPGTTPSDGQDLSPVGEWTSELMSLVARRAGHYFTLIVALLVPISLINGIASYYAFENLVLITDEAAGTISAENPGAGAGDYALAAGSYLVVVLASLVLSLATARHAWADLHERPETWTESVRRSLPRLGRGAIGLIAILAMLFGAYVLLVISLAISPVLLLLALPAWIIGSLLIWARFSLATTSVALGPGGFGLNESWRLTANRFRGVAGRIGVLTLFSLSLWLLMQVITTPFIAAVGGGSSTTIDPGASEIPVGELLGDNPATFSIGQLFSSLGNGAALVLWAVGFALIYRDVQGPVAEDILAPAGDDDGESGFGHV